MSAEGDLDPRLTTSPQGAVTAALADAVLVMAQLRALATQVRMRPDRADDRARLMLEVLDGYMPAGLRLRGAAVADALPVERGVLREVRVALLRGASEKCRTALVEALPDPDAGLAGVRREGGSA